MSAMFTPLVTGEVAVTMPTGLRQWLQSALTSVANALEDGTALGTLFSPIHPHHDADDPLLVLEREMLIKDALTRMRGTLYATELTRDQVMDWVSTLQIMALVGLGNADEEVAANDAQLLSVLADILTNDVYLMLS